MKSVVRFSIFTLVVGLFLSGPAQAAGGMSTNLGAAAFDGVSDKKKRKSKVVKKKKKTVSRKRIPVRVIPMAPGPITITGVPETGRLLFTLKAISCSAQPMILSDGNIMALGLDNKPTSEFVDQKDLQFARTLKDKLELTEFHFSPQDSKVKTSLISLVRESWSDQDLELIKQLLGERYGVSAHSILFTSQIPISSIISARK